MSRKFILPIVATVFLVSGLAYAFYVQKKEPEALPPVPPAQTPFGDTVAGAGQVEASTESSTTGNIAVGSQLSGAVTKVRVHIGQKVKAGDVLFDLDQRQTAADLQVRQSTLVVAQEQLHRLKLQPRAEEVTVCEDQLKSAEADLALQKDLYDRMQKIVGTGALSEEEYRTRKLNFVKAQKDVLTATANLALLKAGAWDADIAIAAATVENAKAQVEQLKTTLDLLMVRASVDGTILQINVRPGEYVATAAGQTLLMMGALDPLNVRVNIDEEDIPRLKLNAPARAKLRGDVKQEEVLLTFVRLEPYVVPKTSLTGTNTERVDTRVVQIIYAIDPSSRLVQGKKILVGQLLDVFIDTHPTDQPSQ